MSIWELGVKSIPSVIFLIAALKRYNEIKSIGLTRIANYSVFYKLKIVSSYLMASLNILLILLSFIMSKEWFQALWMVKTENRFLSLVYLINVAAWVSSGLLLRFEYRRRLSESIYAHYLFWVLSFIVILVVVIVNVKYYVRALN